jgi:hypothetical protein
MRLYLWSAIVLLLAPSGSAQDTPPPPKGVAPLFGLASAVEKDGKVVIELCEARDVARIRVMDHDEFIQMDYWLPLATATLNKDIRAYRLDGKPADPKEVLKALGKQRSVVYFLGFDKAKPVRPDPFYLSVLEKGSVVLALEIPERAPPPAP